MSETETGAGAAGNQAVPGLTEPAPSRPASVVLDAHGVLEQVQQHLHGRFGPTGPVWVAPVRTDDGTAVPALAFQIWFKQGGRDVVLTVSVRDLERDGTGAIDGAYGRLMGR